jgi:class 3 adenylate cyclase
LLRIMPAAVVGRLRSGEAKIAESIDDATVLFADLVGFTALAASRTPAELVDILEQMFVRFDAIAEDQGLEKIKTIGDAYMAVAGVIDQRPGHAARAAVASLKMRDAVAELAGLLRVPLQIRVGLHRGPLVAGVLGQSRLAFDVWGDTVNVASRMESQGAPGEIHLTRALKDALPKELGVRARGVIEVKGLGSMETYFLEG